MVRLIDIAIARAAARRCGWHEDSRGRRICRDCAPKVLDRIARVREQRDSYASSLTEAVQQVHRLDRKLSKANALLAEAAAIFKRGRTARPLSGRIVAFLEGPDA